MSNGSPRPVEYEREKRLITFHGRVLTNLPGISPELLRYWNDNPAELKEVLAKLQLTTVDTVDVTVDYRVPINDLIEVGGFDHVYNREAMSHVRVMNPGARLGERSVRFQLIHFNRPIERVSVATELELLQMRPTYLREILTFGIVEPQRQLEYPIASIHACGKVPAQLAGAERVSSYPVLGRCATGERTLNLGHPEEFFTTSERILAVKKAA